MTAATDASSSNRDHDVLPKAVVGAPSRQNGGKRGVIASDSVPRICFVTGTIQQKQVNFALQTGR